MSQIFLSTVFDNYEHYNSFVERNMGRITGREIERDEILNEAIVQLSNSEIEIEGRDNIDAYIKSTIKNIAIHARIYTKNINGNGKNKSLIRDVGLVVSESFEGKSFAVEKCHRCGSTSLTYWARSQILRCNSCNTDLTLKTGTYMQQSKLSLHKVFQMCKVFCKEMKKPYMNVHRSVGVSSKTAYLYKRLIISAIKTYHTIDPLVIFGKIISPIKKNPINIRKLRRDLTAEEICAIVDMKKDGYHRLEISKKFKRDVKCIDDILYGNSYKNVEREILEKSKPIEFSEEQIFEIVFYRQEGKSIEEISKLFNTNTKKIHKILYGETYTHINRHIFEKGVAMVSR